MPVKPDGDHAAAADGFDAALALHRQGRLAEAEAAYLALVRDHPDHFDAWRCLGVIACQTGQSGRAADVFARAIALKPAAAEAHGNLGVALMDLQRFAEALASYDQALALKPDYAEAHYNRGNALQALSRPQEALASYGRALAVWADYIDALNNRANLLRRLGRPADALIDYDQALDLRAADVQTLANRGGVLLELTRFDEALASLDRALAAAPDHVEALNARGSALAKLGRPGEAVASYDHALALQPAHADALYNRANVLLELRRPDQALAGYDQALSVRPGHGEAYNNRGNALVQIGRLDEALASYDRALVLQPGYAEAHNNRGNVLMQFKRLDAALASYEKALAIMPEHAHAFSAAADCAGRLCDWERRAGYAARLPAHVRQQASVVSPFVLLGYSADPALQLQCAQTYIAAKVPRRPPPLYPGPARRGDRIRIAYLSADFRTHPVPYLLVEMFERHDRSRFEVIAISVGADDGGDMRRRLEAAFDQFHDVRGQSDQAIAELLAHLQVDIAIDLMGYTQDARPGILARRPAPVQASYLGFPATMGADFIDYILADAVVAPLDQQPFFSEAIVHLPHSYWVCDTTRPVIPTAPTRREEGLPEQGFVFCCFNNCWKITPETFDVWMRLLRQTEGGVLWLLGDNEGAERNLRTEAQRRGVDPSRLVFARRLPSDQHLARHRLADLFLDTLPYNAHTTASDALWAGLPVLTCPGESFVGRVAASLLQAMDLPELVAPDLAVYEALALTLAHKPALLAAIKAKLADNRDRCALFDTGRFTRDIEAAYSAMHERAQRGAAPASFSV